ncbi:ferritin, middle subunit-like isoform X2 [Macrosteles quadrilineatus]|uniref:ferritin, middle subunit-like isoform X2 n=1 Tax=Macrosteles quadrilineatus TaxID=74068 RepID=UPI0023E1428D|nr:ferritin, middle subunit-like isoform X2 [Macrosteles quadrilineatus]XP_054265034.1 ferritin, middle subunit-like isoform X2 [Macrosteles quadrilineatus]XP_054265036.1 ferritin, middle subunit-like isoform X2 [Macrosteles quadrilineatus]XP_054265037.1 ferritin, middle subunit-like isoform X2 [Macrosteles quadrilineatus]
MQSTCLSRPDVALPGYARFFAAAATEEQHHAELLASFVNSRGGDVAIRDVPAPSLAPVHDPVVALHHSIDLERSVLASLEELHKIASTHGDSYLTGFLEEHFISEGYESIRQLAEMLTKLQRAGSAEGIELLDLDLLRHPPKICERYKK